MSRPHRDGATYAPTATTARKVCEPGDFTFAAVGLDHGHIYGMCNGLLEAGAQLRWVYDPDSAKVEQFRARYPDVKAARSEQEALDDPQVNLVAGAAIPVNRADLGLRALDHGKHYFTDKPPMTTLGQLAQARAKTEATGKKYAVYYSERLHVESAVYAGRLIADGAIGRVIQVMGMGPHRMSRGTRPDWFYDRDSYGGILCDIGSHQLEQVLFYGGSDDATITSARVANYAHKDHPGLEDFGDVNVVLANGATGYCRVDWFTPDALGTWGDGRTFILGTEGYLELRKYTDVARDTDGDHVYLVNHDTESHIPVHGKVGYPFFGELILDCLNGTEHAMTQSHAFAAAELCLRAQQQATRLELPSKINCRHIERTGAALTEQQLPVPDQTGGGVPAEDGRGRPLAAVQRDELPVGRAALLDRRLGVVHAVPVDLDLHVVLVAPEVRQRRERLHVPPEQVHRRRPALLGRVHPVLDPHPPLVTGVDPGRHVARRVDARRGPAELVALDPVPDREPRGTQPLGGRRRADGNQRALGRDHAAVRQRDPGQHAAVAHQLGDADTGAQVDPVLAVQPGDLGADHRPDLADHRLRERLDDGDVETEPARGRRHLQAEETAADDDDPGRAREGRPQRRHVRMVAEHVHAGQLVPGRQPPRPRPGRDDQPVEAERVPVAQVHGPAVGVEGARLAAHQPDAELSVMGGLAEPGPLGIPRPGQHLLGQRRPVVRELGLGADHGERPGVPLRAQGLNRGQPGRPAPDDEHALH